MRLKIFSLFTFFILFSLFPSQQIQEISLQYSTSGYSENSTSNQKTFPSVLVPSVNAEMSVSESGAFTYALPIEVIKGLNGLQPNVALVYNSQNGNGQSGWGWNIVGLSTITRGGKSKEIDGITIGSQFNDTDPYYLDGQRLIKINATEFTTEKFSKVKISKPASGEFQFIIQYTDGKIAKYKELVTGQFYISSLIDSFNNEVHYSYQVENNVPLVTKVSYGGNSPVNDKFYVNFIYKARQKNIEIFRKGISYITSKVLSEINTGSSYNPLYRKYTLSYDFVEDNSVERLRTILVNNENGESLKPLNFNYNTSNAGTVKVTGNTQSKLSYSTTGLGSVTMGDFLQNDIEKIQPVFQERLNNGYNLKIGTPYSYTNVTNITTNNSGTLLFSGKVLDLNNRITEKDQLIIVNETSVGTADLDNPNNSSNQQLKDEIIFEIKNLITGDQRKVTVPVKGGLVEVQNYVSPDPYDNYNSGIYQTTYTRDETRREYVQGDFNNDGLIDFLIIEPQNFTRGNRIYWAEIGKQNAGASVQLNPVILSEALNISSRDIYPIEFDGDGLPELLAIDKYGAKYSVYKINLENNTIGTLISDQSLSNFGTKTPLFLGDFNGDGLTDFLTPQTVYEIPVDDNSGLKLGDTYYRMQTETLLWWKYTGNGVSFIKNQEDYTQQKIAYLKPSQSNYIKRSTFWQKFWNGQPDEYEYTRYSTHNIIVTDFNNDGRSDIITLDKIGKAKYSANGSLAMVNIDNLPNILSRKTGPLTTTQFISSLVNMVNFYENKNLQGGTFQQLSSFPIESNKISPLSLIVSATNFDYLNMSKSGAYIYDPLVGQSTSITIDNSNFLEKQIQEVNNGTDVLQKVDYRNMVPKDNFSTDKGELTYLYKSQDYLKYPYYVHKTNAALYLVNKIHTSFDSKILTKEYRYENGIQHLEGKGFLGFQKTYSSDAYETEIKGGKYINKNPAKAVFWKIDTRAPEMDNAVVKSTYGGINKFFTENITTNKKFDKGNHQYLILATDEVSKDYLKKITISKKYIYDETDDLKLKSAETDFSGVGSSISKYIYKQAFSNGDHNFYGKIASVEGITYKDGLSFTTKNESEYFTNGNVSEVRKYGNQPNATPVITSYTYDNVGNLKTETLSATGITPQTTTYDYDVTNRYVNKTTTADGLFSTAIISTLGRTDSEVSPLGVTTSYTYDSWGNITEITDFLGKKTTISKSVADASTGGIYNLHKKRDGGTETIVTFDKFDREVQSRTQSINGKWTVVKTEYDILGRKIRFSEPFYEGEPVRWNSIEYDELNRPIKNTDFNGHYIITCYEGLKVTVDDLVSKKNSKTLDAMGNTIRFQDHGGVINYFYYPNGALKETNYEGIKTTFEIDGWGSKTKITDPSAGIFTYEYDNLGRITKETTPKGYTLYTYDNLGRPLTEKVYGNTPAENTNIEKTYTYNGQTKLPETITGVSNGKTFTYTTYYDQYFRIKGKKEQTPDFTYTSSTTFDSFGRADVVSMSTTIANPNYTSNSSVKNVYDANGILVQQNDNENGTMVWHLSDVSARGQTKQLEYGNGYTLVNQYYDLDYSLFNIKHQNTNNGNVALDMDYNHNTTQGILNFRRNNIFGKKEDFTYDLLNRLLTEAVNGVITNQYTYDKRGRITSNTELGKYNYNESDYKLKGIDFNTNGQNVNAQRGFASVTYNAFKSPLQITLAGKEDLSFEYNILKTRYSMKSSVTGQNKWYSSDFAVEITKESNGKTQLVTYITGDPYSANYIKKEILNGGTLTENGNYYLHRDNIGSILAISKTDGSVVEKRFFDAWGNLKGLINASGQLITDPSTINNYTMFLDRGYTGHEHLWRTGLINMNARLYDPILRKFLSPDNFVQDPFNTQNYDRFGYVYNNPLLYVDKDGNEFISLGVAVVIGVAVAITTKAIMNMISGIPFWYGMGKSAVMGAVSGAISFGIGTAATSMFGQGLSFGKALFEAGAHALSSGNMAAMGGEFGGSAFLSGAVSSIVASGMQGLGGIGNFGNKNPDLLKAIMITTGGLSGGISSTIAGGNFWDGFKQGLITSGLNHVVHMGFAAIEAIIVKDKIQQILEKNNIDPRGLSTQQILTKYKEIFKEYWDKSAQWAEFADAKTIAQWEGNEYKGYLSLNNGMIQTIGGNKDYGITNPINGKVLLSTGRNNYSLASTFIHEMVHSIDFVSGLQSFMNNFQFGHDYIESRAYMEEAKWTGGYINSIGQNHIIRSMQVHLSLFNFIR
ncbi:hypothetical protein HHL23_20210 [Chryseobacterium sp. RP-3-3]|uniref:RHS repeat-associated core domain-containing protein n=1 Tax=Chryseobacterium antibioticum TaxID=2728847 RepID=A0A7Y0ARL3_9FLAO|nr:RHS repeat-associated core domain-containing protein [Chryseobacterium antibioticum]NML72095.1 hypothetical protein [Chryseobacterium antibioticum]